MPSKKSNTFYGVILVLVMMMMPFVPQKAHAYWSDAIPAAYIKQALEVAYDQIQGAILGAQKALSVQVLYEQVVNTIAGTGGEILYVTDIDDFLSIQPKEEAKLILNDFFSDVTRGKDVCSYVSEWVDPKTNEVVQTGGDSCSPSDGLNFGRSYLQKMTDEAEEYVFGQVEEQSYSIIDEVCPPDLAESMFAEGNLRCYFTFIDNNEYKMNLEAEEIFLENKERLEQQNETQFVGYQGYLPKTEGENIITPGSLIKDINSAVNDIGTLFAAGTSNPAEFLGYMAGAYVNRMIMQTIEEGVGEVKATLNRELGQVIENVEEVTDQIEEVEGTVRNFKPQF